MSEFLSLCSFYRRLVPKFVDIAKPLTLLARKDTEFTRNPECQEGEYYTGVSFCGLHLPFIPSTGASKVVLGTILSQMQNGVNRPIVYASRQLKKAEFISHRNWRF
jgi:hypothetical protein